MGDKGAKVTVQIDNLTQKRDAGAINVQVAR
jgi:hypothetical protein